MAERAEPLRVTYQGDSYDAACLLAALFNHTVPAGLGVLTALAHDAVGPMTRVQALRILEAHQRSLPHRQPFEFDYVLGRPIKVRANREGVIDEHSVRLYERDAGTGAFLVALVSTKMMELKDEATWKPEADDG